MPHKDDPRVMVRMSRAGHAVVARAAESVNVSVSGLMRECAERYAVQVAQAIERGEITIRRARIDAAMEAAPVRPAREVVAPSLERGADPGWERQARLNAMREKRK